MALIFSDGTRPALLIRDGDFRPEEGGGLFRAKMSAARNRIRSAIRSVARVEMDGSIGEFIGTAFAVSHNLYATARFIGEAIDQGLQRSEGPVSAWLNHSDGPTALGSRLPILKVHQVHPHWGVAFLEVQKGAQPLELEGVQKKFSIKGSCICVIGYPALDARSDPQLLNAVFGGIWGAKRLMPGFVSGIERIGSEDTPMIVHDASTSGGTGGAPVLELETGRVVGIQHSGEFAVRNLAVQAWELLRDPQWRRIWDGAPPASPAAASVYEADDIFDFDDITEINRLIMITGVTTDDDVNALFAGLPSAFLASLPTAAKVSDRLRLALFGMNGERVTFRGRLPLYYVIKNAVTRRSYDTAYASFLNPFLSKLDTARLGAHQATTNE